MFINSMGKTKEHKGLQSIKYTQRKTGKKQLQINESLEESSSFRAEKRSAVEGLSNEGSAWVAEGERGIRR